MKAPILVWVLAAAFLLLVASLLIGSFTKPEFPPYQLGAHDDSTYTLDASRGDEWRWIGALGFRRNHIITLQAQARSTSARYSSTRSRSCRSRGTSQRRLQATPPTPASGSGTTTACGRTC